MSGTPFHLPHWCKVRYPPVTSSLLVSRVPIVPTLCTLSTHTWCYIAVLYLSYILILEKYWAPIIVCPWLSGIYWHKRVVSFIYELPCQRFNISLLPGNQWCQVLISTFVASSRHPHTDSLMICFVLSSGQWVTNWVNGTLRTAAGAGQLCPYDQKDWDNGDRPYCGKWGKKKLTRLVIIW